MTTVIGDTAKVELPFCKRTVLLDLKPDPVSVTSVFGAPEEGVMEVREGGTTAGLVRVKVRGVLFVRTPLTLFWTIMS